MNVGFKKKFQNSCIKKTPQFNIKLLKITFKSSDLKNETKYCLKILNGNVYILPVNYILHERLEGKSQYWFSLHVLVTAGGDIP